MQLSDFAYELPEELIAQEPPAERDGARMLVLERAAQRFTDRTFRDLPEYLAPGDCLVLNDSRVLPSRLHGHRAEREGAVEVMLIEPVSDDAREWRALVRPGRKLPVGERVVFDDRFAAEITGRGERGERIVRFTGPESVYEALDRLGHMPLPPYIRRQDGARDRERYQTVFAKERGSVAAPTAGLHFTESLMARLAARGVGVHTVTLHVGAGTFLPVKADEIAAHRMHAEWGQVSAEVAQALNAVPGRIVAVGTTSLRLLESAARHDGAIAPFAGDTSLFITPGYGFRAVDVLLTNFHLPRSTLFMLVAAFCGLDTMKRAYAHAVATGYRFYSYGDACLLFRNPE